MRRLAVVSAALIAVAALGGCEADGGIAGPERGAPLVFGGPASSLIDTAVVGSWNRVVSSIDEAGLARSIETIWLFNADGSAVRTTITRDALGGIIDRQDAMARWTIQGSEVVLDFTAPITGRVPLPFQRIGETLILGGQTFVRRV